LGKTSNPASLGRLPNDVKDGRFSEKATPDHSDVPRAWKGVEEQV
jgi:hypothetical protein